MLAIANGPVSLASAAHAHKVSCNTRYSIVKKLSKNRVLKWFVGLIY